MAVLTANKTRPVKAPPGGCKFRELPLAGYTNYYGGNVENIVYKGSIVVCDITDTPGYYHAPIAIATTNAAADDVIGGIAMEKKSVLAANTADGSKHITVAVDGVWKFENQDTLTIADEGKPAYAEDDDRVNATSTNAWWIGYIINVDADFIWVDIKPACGALNVAPT